MAADCEKKPAFTFFPFLVIFVVWKMDKDCYLRQDDFALTLPAVFWGLSSPSH